MAFLFSWGLVGGCGCGAGCRAGNDAGFRCVLLCLSIMMKIEILNSIKTKRILSLCRKPLWCAAGIFAVINDVVCLPDGFI